MSPGGLHHTYGVVSNKQAPLRQDPNRAYKADMRWESGVDRYHILTFLR